MSTETGQVALDQARIANFYHDLFVQSQAEDFAEICAPVLDRNKVVADMGGGCGFFADAVRRDLGFRVRVVDADPVSVATAAKAGIEAVLGDALAWQPMGDESVACFNLILHHLVGRGEGENRRLQMQALERWKGSGVRLFVNEYIYDSWIAARSGALIYRITASRLLSAMAGSVSRFVPSLRANTFGVGVRFRAEQEWRRLFEADGWRVVGYRRGREEEVSLPRRMLLIRSCRRDSFLLAQA
jgi:hypothetical protein